MIFSFPVMWTEHWLQGNWVALHFKLLLVSEHPCSNKQTIYTSKKNMNPLIIVYPSLCQCGWCFPVHDNAVYLPSIRQTSLNSTTCRLLHLWKSHPNLYLHISLCSVICYVLSFYSNSFFYCICFLRLSSWNEWQELWL